MKKNNISLIILILITLTGCNNTLNCNIKTDNYTSSIKVKFKNNKPITYIFKDKMKFSKTSINKKDYYKEKYDKYNILISNKNMKLKSKRYYISTKTNYKFKNNKSNQENKLLIKRDYTRKQTLKKIKSLGYACK